MNVGLTSSRKHSTEHDTVTKKPHSYIRSWASMNVEGCRKTFFPIKYKRNWKREEEFAPLVRARAKISDTSQRLKPSQVRMYLRTLGMRK